MRPFAGFAGGIQLLTLGLVASLVACGGAQSEVTGTAGGITFGKSTHVYVGGPFIVIAQNDAACTDFSWVDRNYEVGVSPTETDTAALQFAFAAETIAEGKTSVAVDASVSSTVVSFHDGAFTFARATGGVLTVDSFVEDESADGSFEGVVGSSRVDLQACKLEYSIVSPK